MFVPLIAATVTFALASYGYHLSPHAEPVIPTKEALDCLYVALFVGAIAALLSHFIAV